MSLSRILPRFLCGLLLLHSSSALAQVPTDFDGDGASEIASVSASGSSLSWKSVNTSSGTTVFSEAFGLATDSVALAHWLDTGTPVLGALRLRERGNKLIWKVLASEGVVRELSFGKGGDAHLAGGDYNGNGIGDAALVRNSRGKILWRIKPDPFTTPGRMRKLRFGITGDRVFFADPTGGGDWIGHFGLRGKKRTLLKLRDPFSRAARSTRKIPRRFAREPRPRPMPLKQADGTDLLVFVLSDETDTSIHTFDLSGNQVGRISFVGLGNAVIGDFNAEDAGEEVALQLSTTTRIYNPVTGSVREAGVVGGLAVDELNIETISTVATPDPVATAIATPMGTPTATPPSGPGSTPWRNPDNPLDVDDNGQVNSNDLVVVAQQLSLTGTITLPPPTQAFAPPPYYDVNGDNTLSSADVAALVTALQSTAQSPSG